MKNFSKFFGIIAFVALTGLFIAACDDGATYTETSDSSEGPVTIIINNLYQSPITHFSAIGYYRDDLNIEQGNNQTFTIHREGNIAGGAVSVRTQNLPNEWRTSIIPLLFGKTTIVRLGEDGAIYLVQGPH